MTDHACLVVDDDEAMRMLTTVQLRATGGRIEEASSVVEAVELIQRTGPFTMIVADRRLGGGTSGVDVLREGNGDHNPVLYLMTAHVDATVLTEAEAVGATPVDKLDLRPMLDRWEQLMGNGSDASPQDNHQQAT